MLPNNEESAGNENRKMKWKLADLKDLFTGKSTSTRVLGHVTNRSSWESRKTD